MNTSEKTIITKNFSRYYESAELSIPSINKREFGFGNVKKIDARHLNFETKEELRRYLVTSTPLFLSHSVSYYNFPGATPMERKEWLGADLVFDFDAHSEDKYGVYKLLGTMKDDAIRLVEDFLVSDFGISKKDIKIVFSGNRGYHVHVHDGNYFDLSGDDRKEVVDYIRGIGLQYKSFFYVDNYVKAERWYGPRPEDGGYRGRFAREVIKTVEEKPSAISRVFSGELARSSFINNIKKGNWSTSFKHDDLVSRLAPIAEKLPLQRVDADAGVSYDVSKLIRAPNSLHGDTGLIAKVVGDISSFEPLRDAINPSKTALKVKFTEDAKIDGLNGTSYDFRKDDSAQLPQWVAMFFVLRNSATITS